MTLPYFGVWAFNHDGAKPALLSSRIKLFKAADMMRFSMEIWVEREGWERELHMVVSEVKPSSAEAQGPGMRPLGLTVHQVQC